MPPIDLDGSSDDEATDEPHLNGPPTKGLSCPECNTDKKFLNASKLNQHINSHTKPYECFAEGCYDRFAQRQALDRHTERKHGGISNQTKYYHCTVDGCKYSSNGRKRKRFLRVDQVKQHIKDYGHYGPHSANDRLRRPGSRIDFEHEINALFEEWSFENGTSQRKVQHCNFRAPKTDLWHKDNIGELFVVNDQSAGDGAGYDCAAPDCYYRSLPPEGCNVTLFKTIKGLQEHCRRAHQVPFGGFPPFSQFESQGMDRHASANSLSSMESSSSSMGSLSICANVQPFPHSPQDLNYQVMFGADHVEGGQCICIGCMQFEDQKLKHLARDPCMAGSGLTCFCQACVPRDRDPLQQPDMVASSYEFRRFSHQFDLSSISPSSILDYSIPNILEEDTLNISAPSPASSSSILRHDSLKLPSSRVRCPVYGCGKTFRRKYELERHVKHVHNPELTFSCNSCTRQFKRKDKLVEHTRNMHLNAPYSESLRMSSISGDSSDLSTIGGFSSTMPSVQDAALDDAFVDRIPGPDIWPGDANYMLDIHQFQHDAANYDPLKFETALSNFDTHLHHSPGYQQDTLMPSSPRTTHLQARTIGGSMDTNEGDTNWI